jgi:ribosomal subunit interface protein
MVIHVREIEDEEPIKESIEKHCQRLADEFHEITRMEISLSPNGVGFLAHAHLTGKGTDVSTQAEASEPRPAADLVFDKVERHLRRAHDKRIFAQRRDAQRDPPKRKGRA